MTMSESKLNQDDMEFSLSIMKDKLCGHLKKELKKLLLTLMDSFGEIQGEKENLKENAGI